MPLEYGETYADALDPQPPSRLYLKEHAVIRFIYIGIICCRPLSMPSPRRGKLVSNESNVGAKGRDEERSPRG